VVIRYSPLSFTFALSPTIDTADDALETLNIPLNARGRSGKISALNADICPNPAMDAVSGATPDGDTSRFVNENVTDTGDVEGFPIAIPESVFASVATYVLKAVPLVTGTPASDTVTPPVRSENTISATGAVPPPAGVMTTGP
jgi:hypothetical protein